MKNTFYFTFFLLFFSTSISAQMLPSPFPVAEKEIREGSSIKIRSIELERVKRDANNRNSKDSPAIVRNFDEVKEDFEEIQILQTKIINIYTKGKEINYEKISRASAEMKKKALRLDKNLFGLKPDEKAMKVKTATLYEQKSVRDLIIELDKNIEVFINSPVFKNNKLVDQEATEKAQNELEEIIRLTEMLSKEAKKMS